MPRAYRERSIRTLPPRSDIERSHRKRSVRDSRQCLSHDAVRSYSRRDRSRSHRERSRSHRERSRSHRDRSRSCRDRSRSLSRHERSRSYSRRFLSRNNRSRSRHDITRSGRDRPLSGDKYSCDRSRSRSVGLRRGTSKTRSNPLDASVKDALGSIMSRLTAIEENTASGSHVPSSVRCSTPPLDKNNVSATQAFVEALGMLTRPKPSNYYVSNFDPAVNNFGVWCAEVERAIRANHWDDYECFSRVANCLRGDAKAWLNEWATNERSWSNFVREFRSLCPQTVNYAQILHEVINSTSEKFMSYAEFARRSLLRLRLVNGLSEELMVQIVIFGINDVQVRAAATNADLTTENLVSFLATYVKSARKFDNRNPDRPKSFNSSAAKKRNFGSSSKPENKCFVCGERGHFRDKCPKKRNVPENTDDRPVCYFCKKRGHRESDCFAKARSAVQSGNNSNQRRVNLCNELLATKNNNDISTAVIQGIPVDILIDSGALNVSLISSAVVNYFSGSRRPINCSLKGIGDKEFVAHEYITLTVELRNIALEVDFLIVPASYMNTPIIIGTDVLNRDGVTFIRTKHEQYLTHTPDRVLGVNAVNANGFDNINTPLEGAELANN
ncbi:unnamed protein product [Pieris macdunnoughi]|uniref:CCHC-type domain-containing protein n=1 Tax=Pieris macdunnoughi TaxID=345717 RepID=A0A821QVA6_9NEOP|nr:unnamed protein product [Pieris macdunnoughi]